MPLLLDLADAATVRAAIGASVSAADVSDEMVMLDIYAGVASDRVLEWRDALTTSILVPDDDPRLRRAATFLTASMIAGSGGINHLLSERTPDYQYTAQAIPAEMLTAKQDALYAEAYAAVARAAGAASDALPSAGIFDVAHGYRGRLTGGTVYSETDIPGRLFG